MFSDINCLARGCGLVFLLRDFEAFTALDYILVTCFFSGLGS